MVHLAGSADGSKLVLASFLYIGYSPDGGVLSAFPIYLSADAGATWTQSTAPNGYWQAVASSADGSKLVAAGLGPPAVGDLVPGPGPIYYSTNSGTTWAPSSAPSNYWSSVASSADGIKLVAAIGSDWYNIDGFVGRIGLIYASTNAGATWAATSAPSNNWSSVACSADGTKLVAASKSAIYCSADSGATWVQTTAPANYWEALASSADGTKLVAAAYGQSSDGLVYISTDGGMSWRATEAPEAGWMTLASSADGYRLVAASSDGYLCTLPYAGPWRLVNTPTNEHWGLVACSTDGMKLVAALGPTPSRGYGPAPIYTSTNSGTAWIAASAPKAFYQALASSADGSRLAAIILDVGNQGGDWAASRIYISSNSGASWTATTAPTNDWQSVACSNEGTILAAVAPPLVFTSTNAGALWTPGAAPVANWQSVTVSGDGSTILAAGDGPIAILRSPAPASPLPPSPTLEIAFSDANAAVSWLVPSTSFVLQQTPDLVSPNWIDLTNQPTLNLTNLHNQVNLPPISSTTFYRLKQR